MNVKLENELLRVEVATLGAELKIICIKETQREVLWNADPKFWSKTSPVLFPIVGALKEDTFIYERKAYHLPRHGFARDRVFEVENQTAEEAVFVLRDDVSSRAVFPFAFEFRICYRLEGASLHCTYAVFNPADADLLFSVGGHPAFSVRTSPDVAYSDYYLQFNKDEELKYYPLVDNAIGERFETLLLKDQKLPLIHELFYKDALVLKDLKSDEIRLRNGKNSQGINFRFEGFPYFGIWAAKDADFVCLEPWCGIADGVGHNQEFAEKEGIILLKPESVFTRSWSVELI